MEISGLRHLGSTTLGGRPDGLQVVGTGSRVFVSHLFSNGVTEVDLADPRCPRVLSFIPAPPGSWSVHLQVQGDLLMVANGPDMWSAPTGFDPGRTLFSTEWHFAAGVGIFDVATPGRPREIGFADVGGTGVHRLWFDGSDHVYASAFPPGFDEALLLVLNVSRPEKPEEVQRYWLPGLGPGEEAERPWEPDRRVSLHHATVGAGYAYGAWRDGGITVHPLGVNGQLAEPSSLVWDSPYGDGCAAHTALHLPGTELVAVAEEGIEDAGQPQLRVVSLIDMSDPAGLRRIGHLPVPDVSPVPGARFGPHNLYEYRPGAWMDGSLVFSAHQASGLRVYRIGADGRADEVAVYRGDPPAVLLDPRPGRALIASTNDVFVTAEGLLAVIDANRGLDVLELVLP